MLLTQQVKRLQSNQKRQPKPEGSCFNTKQPLWDTDPTGAVRYLAPHGLCNLCKRWYHMDEMHSITIHKTPIRILGGHCQACHKLPIPKNDPIFDIKLREN